MWELWTRNKPNQTKPKKKWKRNGKKELIFDDYVAHGPTDLSSCVRWGLELATTKTQRKEERNKTSKLKV